MTTDRLPRELREWLMADVEAPAAPVTRPSQHVDLMPLATAVREKFREERRERAELEREVSALKSELATVRAEVALEMRIRNILDRLDNLEARPRGAGLRAV
jgi:predicted nuclease with TOPRIM domain